jgi:hypothetical protein
MSFLHLCRDVLSNEAITAASDAVIATMAVVAWITTVFFWLKDRAEKNRLQEASNKNALFIQTHPLQQDGRRVEMEGGVLVLKSAPPTASTAFTSASTGK